MPKLSFNKEELFNALETIKNKNSFRPGFDKMTPDAAETWFKVNGDRVCKELNSGKYQCMPASGFFSAKYDGSFRKLSRLTIIDTVIETVILEKISPVCESKFSEYSFAYRKGRGMGNALRLYCDYAGKYPFAAKVDPRACFDNIDIGVLEKAFYQFFYDRKTVNLLMNFAKMPVITEGQLVDRRRGILQGAPLSAIFCNICFDSMDKALEEEEIAFIRYADDTVVFGSTRAELEKNRDFVCDYLENKLRLTVNRNKSVTDASEELVFLGQKFMRDREGAVSISSCEKTAAVYYDWFGSRPANHRGSIDILSDGILRQKDFSAIFDSETGKSNIPLASTKRINVFSNVIFDSRFLATAMNEGIAVNVFGKDYSYIGRFVPSTQLKDQALIFEQLTEYNDEKKRLYLAKEFNLASVHNLRLNLRYYNKHKPDDCYDRALASIEKLFIKMKTAESYESLLLIEAQIRAAYFACFDAIVRGKPFPFEKRTKQPPLNEFNSMISFGNTVLYNYIATELYKSALDIRVGYLHATNRRAESLNLDIAEIFRPLIVDRVVFKLINRGEIKQKHFEVLENGGIYLNNEGKKVFLAEFYEKMGTVQLIDKKYMSYAELINEEIRKLVRHFRHGESYKAFRQVR